MGIVAPGAGAGVEHTVPVLLAWWVWSCAMPVLVVFFLEDVDVCSFPEVGVCSFPSARSLGTEVGACSFRRLRGRWVSARSVSFSRGGCLLVSTRPGQLGVCSFPSARLPQKDKRALDLDDSHPIHSMGYRCFRVRPHEILKKSFPEATGARSKSLMDRDEICLAPGDDTRLATSHGGDAVDSGGSFAQRARRSKRMIALRLDLRPKGRMDPAGAIQNLLRGATRRNGELARDPSVGQHPRDRGRGTRSDLVLQRSRFRHASWFKNQVGAELPRTPPQNQV
jgi:hypothetical protein